MKDPREKAGEEIGEVIANTILDQETEAWTFAALGPKDRVINFGESIGREASFTKICATVLVQFASTSKHDEETFIKKVIQEYNQRKKESNPINGKYDE